jgi:hypothetical protein
MQQDSLAAPGGKFAAAQIVAVAFATATPSQQLDCRLGCFADCFFSAASKAKITSSSLATRSSLPGYKFCLHGKLLP